MKMAYKLLQSTLSDAQLADRGLELTFAGVMH